MKKWLAVGKILRPWGVRGELKCISYNRESSLFREISKIYIPVHSMGDAARAASVVFEEDHYYKSYQIEGVRVHGAYWLLKLQGIDAPEVADPLRNMQLFIQRDELPPLGRGEIYLSDLEGYEVLSPDGKSLGHIVAFQKVGDSDVMLIGANIAQALWVPYESQFIASSLHEQRKLTLTSFAMELIAVSQS